LKSPDANGTLDRRRYTPDPSLREERRSARDDAMQGRYFDALHARSLGPLVKARALGMTRPKSLLRCPSGERCFGLGAASIAEGILAQIDPFDRMSGRHGATVVLAMMQT